MMRLRGLAFLSILACAAAHQEMLKAPIAATLKESTFFVFATHGERSPANRFRSSYGEWINVHPTNEVTPMLDPDGAGIQFRTDTWAKDATPHHNIILFYGCDTLTGSGNDSHKYPENFGIKKPGPPPQINSDKVDRAWGGFNGVVHSRTLNNYPLSTHTEAVFSYLKAGWTIDEAIARANRDYPPKSLNDAKLSMVVAGDKFTTIATVYQASRIGTKEEKPWFKIL